MSEPAAAKPESGRLAPATRRKTGGAPIVRPAGKVAETLLESIKQLRSRVVMLIDDLR